MLLQKFEPLSCNFACMCILSPSASLPSGKADALATGKASILDSDIDAGRSKVLS